MSTRRDGFTFIEFLLVLVLGMMLLGGAFSTLSRQEQAYGLFRAAAANQQDTRNGVDLLAAEFREVSAGGSDLLMATPDSVRFRALRKFGLLCDKNKMNKKLVVAQVGADRFVAGDSLLIYVDQDSLKAADDFWQREVVQSVAAPLTCGTTLGLSLGLLLPNANLLELTLPGAGLKYDSIYPGAPVRSFETLTYRAGESGGERMLLRVQNGTATPLFGPLKTTNGLVISYYDTLGTQLTSFPLSPAARGSVQRMRIELRAERRAGGSNRMHSDSLITDIYLRGG